MFSEAALTHDKWNMHVYALYIDNQEHLSSKKSKEIIVRKVTFKFRSSLRIFSF